MTTTTRSRLLLPLLLLALVHACTPLALAHGCRRQCATLRRPSNPSPLLLASPCRAGRCECSQRCNQVCCCCCADLGSADTTRFCEPIHRRGIPRSCFCDPRAQTPDQPATPGRVAVQRPRNAILACTGGNLCRHGGALQFGLQRVPTVILCLSALIISLLRVATGYHTYAQIAVGALLGMATATGWMRLGTQITRAVAPRTALTAAYATYFVGSCLFVGGKMSKWSVKK